MDQIRDIKPYTPIATLDRDAFNDGKTQFDIAVVSPVVGMSTTFIRKVVGPKNHLSASDVLTLLDQDAFSETFVPRSRVLGYLFAQTIDTSTTATAKHLSLNAVSLFPGCATELIAKLPPESVNCVVTSTPYWAMRLYDKQVPVHWADGEFCSFGMEQTPEAFIRHSVEILVRLKPAMAMDGSIWWNLMDTFNTRTQIRSNAAEALRAMQGKDKTGWTEYACRRYSAGHSYLKDGEQCLIPQKIAERASRCGYYVKGIISWTKTSSMPEPQNSRVSRNVEYVIHLSLQRTPKFDKEAYRALPAKLGGRNGHLESDKLSDFWHLPTSAGRDGHGAQFPLALPARCIAISTKQSDLVLDPFVGAGTAGVAAKLLGRRFVGFDISEKYIETARRRLAAIGTEQSQLEFSEKTPLDRVAQGSAL